MSSSHWMLLIRAFVILYVLGQMWYAQVVIYPLFGQVGETEYMDYHRSYSSHIPFPVIVLGFASFILPLVLVFHRLDAVPAWMALANTICALVRLFVTVAFEIPRHARLEKGGKQNLVVRELIACNWPSTLSVAASTGFTLLMLLASFKPA